MRVKVISNALCHTDIYTLDGHDPEVYSASIIVNLFEFLTQVFNHGQDLALCKKINIKYNFGNICSSYTLPTFYPEENIVKKLTNLMHITKKKGINSTHPPLNYKTFKLFMGYILEIFIELHSGISELRNRGLTFFFT